MKKLHFMASGSDRSLMAAEELKQMYSHVGIEEAEVIIALGGDGFLLQTFHKFPHLEIPVYAMNRGTIGFLLNEYNKDELYERLENALEEHIYPIKMEAVTINGRCIEMLAYNEISVLRHSAQSANLSVEINGEQVLDHLSCDGLLVATPAGSTAYNLSANGPVIPLNSNLLALTPVSAFRPRRWRGALLPNDVEILIENLDPKKRPIAAAADSREVNNILKVMINQKKSNMKRLLFDKNRSLNDRILKEQFSV